jgi:hypothetical protein
MIEFGKMQKDAGAWFIRNNFEPEDRLAVVLIDRRSGSVTQRIAPARQIATAGFQAWLKERNRIGADVFVSMNALHGEARGRTRGDIAVIRHLYLDSTMMAPRRLSVCRAGRTCQNRAI